MKVLIHVGFPKTMSSTLQFGLFKPLHDNGIINLRTWRQDDPEEHLDFRPSSRLFNGKHILDHSLELREDILNVLSDESFTAPIKLRRNNYGNEISDPFSFPQKIKEQINEKYGNDVEFSVLMMIRNHPDLIYSQYVEEYNLKKYKGVDLLFDNDGEIDLKGFEIYRFCEYLKVLESVFGLGKTELFLFEDWKKRFDENCDRLAKIIGVDSEFVKDSLSRSHVNKKKKSSKGYYTKDGSILIPFLSSEQKTMIRNFFVQDNLSLQKMLGSDFDLTAFNYLDA